MDKKNKRHRFQSFIFAGFGIVLFALTYVMLDLSEGGSFFSNTNALLVFGTAILILLLVLGSFVLYLQATRDLKDVYRFNQHRIQFLMDKSDDMIFELSVCGEEGLVTTKVREKFGWDLPTRVEGNTIEETLLAVHIHPEDCKHVLPQMEQFIKTFEPGQISVRVRHADERYIWCRINYAAIVDDQKNLRFVIGKLEDIDMAMQERLRLKKEATTDGLTGLMNRKTFLESVERYLLDYKSYECALIYVDLDRFKEVNDLFGHSAGDRAIKDAASKLQVIFANIDFVARFGGDEFCIFVKNIPYDTLLDKLEWGVDKLSEVYEIGGGSIRVTASIGAVFCKKEKTTFKELFEIAERALYQAKNGGRNQYIIAENNHQTI